MTKAIAHPVVHQMFSSASRGTTTSPVFATMNENSAVFQLDWTAQGGTNPTLDVVIQDGPTETGPWSTLATFTQGTASTGNQVLAASRAPMPFLRAVATVGGSATPVFTFSLFGILFQAAGVAVSTSTSGNVTSTQMTITGSNGAQAVYGFNTELLTLSTGGATTDTTGNLLPAGAIIDAVEAIVTVAITTATAFGLGDPTTATRFTAAAAAAAALGTRIVGIDAMNGNITTTAAGPTQAAAAKVRVTANGTPGAGQVRITVFYRQFIAPTS